jgi:hypothetical protein
LRSTIDEAPRYVVLSTPKLPRPCKVHIYSSAPCSRTLIANVHPSWSTKFHAHTKRVKIVVQWIFRFIHLDSRLEDNRSAPNDSKHSLTSAWSRFLDKCISSYLGVFRNFWNVPLFQKSIINIDVVISSYILMLRNEHMRLGLSTSTSSPFSLSPGLPCSAGIVYY